MDGPLSKNVVTPGEFADRKAVFPRPAEMVIRRSTTPLLRPLPRPAVSLDFTRESVLFAALAARQSSAGEKLTSDLRGVTRIGFTYLLTRQRRVAITPLSMRYFTDR
jgi:hypothetical protein